MNIHKGQSKKLTFINLLMNCPISLIGKPLSHVAGASIQSFFLYFPIVHFATEEVRKFFSIRPKLLKLLSIGTFLSRSKGEQRSKRIMRRDQANNYSEPAEPMGRRGNSPWPPDVCQSRTCSFKRFWITASPLPLDFHAFHRLYYRNSFIHGDWSYRVNH